VKADTHAIALTGGIATGKSSAGKIFSDYGFEIIDADGIAHQMLDLQAEKIAELFGAAYLLEGKVDRKALGAVVFNDAEKRTELEALLHPLIYKRIAQEAEKLDKRAEPYLVDIPLFYEGGRYAIENVIVVYTSKEQQLERLIARDGFSKEEALARIESQICIEDKRDNASYVIDNSGPLNQLVFETERVKDEILGAQL